jgi:hypothetical protein
VGEEAMKSVVHFAEGLDPDIVQAWHPSVNAEQAFIDSQMLVVDEVLWDADMSILHGALTKKRRAFKEPFNEGAPKREAQEQIGRTTAHATRLFKALYPGFKPIMERVSWRPMVTGPEPLHLDTTHNDAPLVTAYINVSPEPRVYNIGPNLPMLLRDHPKDMKALFEKSRAPGKPLDVSYALRQILPDGPLGSKTPRHRVELAPGAIWFFNAKTVSHEVIFGRGAIGISWECPGCGAKSQAELFKEMLT